MAEYKNGVNFRGNMSVEADDISPEVKTGRVVFVDEDLYESNEEYKAKVDKCVEEGFMRSDEAGSGGSSGGGAVLIVNAVDHPDESRVYLDRTWNEIKSAMLNGSVIYVYNVNEPEIHYEPIMDLYYYTDSSTQHSVVLHTEQYDCNSADDYPIYYYGD